MGYVHTKGYCINPSCTLTVFLLLTLMFQKHLELGIFTGSMSHSKELRSSLINVHPHYLGLHSPVFLSLNFLQLRIVPIIKTKQIKKVGHLTRMFGMVLKNEEGFLNNSNDTSFYLNRTTINVFT